MMMTGQQSISRVVRVRGRVQGVGFRASARAQAARLGIDAEPVNLDDGSVRITVTGNEDAIQQFIDWCRHGPPAAQVTDVLVDPDA